MVDKRIEMCDNCAALFLNYDTRQKHETDTILHVILIKLSRFLQIYRGFFCCCQFLSIY